MGGLVIEHFLHNTDIVSYLTTLRINYPVMLSGYFLIKSGLLEKIQQLFNRYWILSIIGVPSALLGYGAFRMIGVPGHQGLAVNSGVIFAPLFIVSLRALFMLGKKNCVLQKIQDVLLMLGKHSLNIWFLHCVFFSVYTREVFQPLVYWVKNPVLVVGLILGMCTGVSILIKHESFLGERRDRK